MAGKTYGGFLSLGVLGVNSLKSYLNAQGAATSGYSMVKLVATAF